MSSANPITEFLGAVERAAARQVDTAPVALATADKDGRPSVRMVLLRGADERGFVFHTNYNSRKALDTAGYSSSPSKRASTRRNVRMFAAGTSSNTWRSKAAR